MDMVQLAATAIKWMDEVFDIQSSPSRDKRPVVSVAVGSFHVDSYPLLKI